MSNFKFEHNGEEFEFEKDLAGMATPRWLRVNRTRDDLDQLFTLIEEFGGDAVVEAVDDMDADEFAKFNDALGKEIARVMEKVNSKPKGPAK